MCLAMLTGTAAAGITVNAAGDTSTGSSASSTAVVTNTSSIKMSNGVKNTSLFNGKKQTVYNITEGSTITFTVKTDAAAPQYAFATRKLNTSTYTVKRNFTSNATYKFTFDKAGQYIVRTIVKDTTTGATKTKYYSINVEGITLKTSSYVSKNKTDLSNIVAGSSVTFSSDYAADKYKIAYKRSSNAKWNVMKDFNSTRKSITFPSGVSYDLRVYYNTPSGLQGVKNYKIAPKTNTVAVKLFNNETERLLYNYEVRLTNSNYSGTAATDDEGNVKFTKVPDGKYTVTLKAIKAPDGFKVDQKDITVTATIKGKGGTVNLSYEVPNTLPGPVSAVTIKTSNSDLAGVEAQILDSDKNCLYTTTLDKEGNASVRLTRGKYYLRINKVPDGFMPTLDDFEFKVNDNAVTVDLPIANDLILKSSTSVSKNCTDMSNIVAGSPVTLSTNYPTDQYKIIYKRHTNSKWIVMKDYDSTKNRITFQSSVPYDLRVYFKTPTGVAMKNYQFTPKEAAPQTGNVHVSISNGPSVSKLLGFTAQLKGKNYDKTLDIDESGNALFTNVPNGTYDLTVKMSTPSEGYNPQGTSATMSVTVDFNWGKNCYVKVPIDVPVPGPLSHISIKAGDSSFAGTKIAIYKDNDLVKTVELDEQGCAEFGLMRGDYVARVVEAPAGYELPTVEIPFTVDQANIDIKLPLEVAQASILAVRVAAGSNTYVAGCTVEISDQDGNAMTSVTNETGLVTFNVLPGQYTVKVLRAPSGFVLGNDDAIRVSVGNEMVYMTYAISQQIVF